MSELTQAVVDKRKEVSFTNPSKATDAEAVGIIVSNYFEWDGIAILEALAYALEDANFHSTRAKIDEIANELKAKKDSRKITN